MTPPKLKDTSTTIETQEIPKGITEHTKKSPDGKKTIIQTKEKVAKTKEETQTAFEEISENPKLDEKFKKVIEGLSFYVELKLNNSKIKFSKIEKDNIKLAIIDDFSKQVNNLGTYQLGNNITKVLNKFKNSFSKNSEKKELNQEKKDDFNDFNDFFKELKIKGLQEGIDEKLGKIINKKKEKGQNAFISGLEIFKSIGYEKQPSTEKITEHFIKASEKFKDYSKIGETVKKTIGEEKTNDLVKWLKDNLGWFGEIIAMFLVGIEQKGDDQKEKSILNLQKLLKNKKKSPLDKIEKNGNFKNKEKLNSEKLKGFYKYLDSKGIKYGDKNPSFWEEFLTGNTNNSKIKELHNLLIPQEKNKTRISLKLVDLEQFIKILNNLGKKETQKQTKEIDEEVKKLKKEGKITPEQLQKINDLKFKKSLLTMGTTKTVWFKLPGMDKYGNISIDLKGKTLELNGEKYNVSLLATEHNNMNVIQYIKFSGNNVSMKYMSGLLKYETKTFSPENFGEIIKEFGKTLSYSKQVPGKPAILEIKKA